MHNASGVNTAPRTTPALPPREPTAAAPRRWPRLALARYRWVAAADRWWLEAHGFTQLDALFALPSPTPSWSPQRRESVRMLHPLADDHQLSLVLKRSRRVTLKDRLGSARRWLGPCSREQREWDTLRRLHTLGIICPRPLVCLEEGLFRSRSCLLFEDIPNGRELPNVLADRAWSPTPDRRRNFFLGLGRHVARLHATGFVHGALFAPAVVVIEHEGQWQFGIQHVGRARQYFRLPLSRRAFDLAALLATLSSRLATDNDRQRLLDAYLQASGLEGEAGELLDAVRLEQDRLLARRRTWEIREGCTLHDELHAAPAVRGNMWIDPEFRPALEQSGLTSLAAVMETRAGKCLRVLKDRENWRLDLPHQHGPSGAYLKKHRIRTFGSWLRAKFQRGPGQTAGRVEAHNIALLRRAGVAAMRLIAFGEQLLPNGELQSFVLTQELAGFTQLDQYLKHHFAGIGQAPSQRTALRTLTYDVADLARKFHQLGYNHRDFYCCHFFVKETEPARYQIHLIDLQRVEHRKHLRRRWIVKDLAQLAYSAPREQISCSDKLAFIKRYLGVVKLRPQDKRLIRQVLAKQTLMEWQLGKHP